MNTTVNTAVEPASDGVEPAPGGTAPAWIASHYQRAILAMAERHAITTREAVYAANGTKLVDRGAPVDQQAYERLARHALRTPLEDLLTTQGLVSVASIVALAHEQCRDDALLALLVQDESSGAPPATLVAPLQAMSLPAPLAFMLTVMRETCAAQFTHAIHVALVAVYLGLRSGWNKSDCTRLASAGLLHDIGVMQLDPMWRDSSRQITGAEREQLASHPIIAAQLVHAQEVYPRSVAVAILEHHERMDGSGYPRGLRNNQISPMGQILLVAEVVAAFFEKYATDGAAVRLSLTLRLSHHKYPAELAALLLPLLQATNIQPGGSDDLAQVRATIARVAQALSHWSMLQTSLGTARTQQGEAPDACSFVAQRLHALQRSLFDAGSHPEQQTELLPLLQDDAEGLREMLFLTREALWQLQAIANTASGRWPAINDSQDAGDTAVREWRDALLTEQST